jgi:hypothetical protein
VTDSQTCLEWCRGKVATELSNLDDVRFGIGETESWRSIEPLASTWPTDARTSGGEETYRHLRQGRWEH